MPGRVQCGGTEGEIVVAHGCRKRKKLICGPEEEIVVAHGHFLSPLLWLMAAWRPKKNNIWHGKGNIVAYGRLPSPARMISKSLLGHSGRAVRVNDASMLPVLWTQLTRFLTKSIENNENNILKKKKKVCSQECLHILDIWP